MARPMIEIHRWNDLAEQFADGLIVGNGGSIAVSAAFSYGSLHGAAVERGLLPPPVVTIFERFATTDFELVLRRLWHAMLVNQALQIPEGPVEAAYRDVRAALIATVQATHIAYPDALPHLAPMYQFMQRFRIVVSLNYDLLVYWAAMLGNETLGNWFKDAFVDRRFRSDWETFREPYGATGATLLFYPHGNLVLARARGGHEVKIQAGQDRDLLDTIVERWNGGDQIPLFVSEGTTDKKEQAIQESPYLRTVLGGPLRAAQESLVIFGWALGEQDQHILACLSERPPQRVAVSVHNNNQAYARAVHDRLEAVGVASITCFHADSPGCWNRP